MSTDRRHPAAPPRRRGPHRHGPHLGRRGLLWVLAGGAFANGPVAAWLTVAAVARCSWPA